MDSKLTKKIKSRFNPTLLNGYPIYTYGGYPRMYGFGSWLKSNAGNIAQTALGAGAMAIPGFQGVGASLLSSGIGGMATTGDTIGNQQEAQAQAQQSALKKEMISNLPAQHYYQPTFATGGKISPSEIAKGTKEEMEHTSSKKVSRKTALDHLKEDPKYYTKLKKAGLADSYAGGGLLPSIQPNITNSYVPQLIDTRNRIYSKDATFNKNTTYFDEAQRLDTELERLKSIKEPTNKDLYSIRQVPKLKNDLYLDQVGGYAMGGNLDNTTVYANGGQHENNPIGGIPVGNNALVEQDEVRFNDYIFSNRIPYKKK